MHPLTNDAIEDAYIIEQIPFTARTDTTGAGSEGESSSCGAAGPTIWYVYHPDSDGHLIASTVGTKRPTSLVVFEGRPDDLQEIRCVSNMRGHTQAAFPIRADAGYYFRVGTPTGGGPVAFHLDPLGRVERASVGSRGEETAASNHLSGLSGDGRWVVFMSRATEFAKGDDNDGWDVFVRDTVEDTTTLVSVTSDGTPGNGVSGGASDSITPDGRYVAFYSRASDLVTGDTNGWSDVFVRDLWTDRTSRVSISSVGEGKAPVDPYVAAWNATNDVDGESFWLQGVSMSADGRFVAFQSALSGLVPGDDEPSAGSQGFDGGLDVFVHDRWTTTTQMVSVHSDGGYGNDWSEHPSISADGRYVAFRSFADNLVDDDTNAKADVFVHDRWSGRTERVSMDFKGGETDDHSHIPDLSADGRFVTFASWASDLVPGDSNRSIDAFLHDRLTGETNRVSVTSDGVQQQGVQDEGNRFHFGVPRVSVSDDGRYVAFHSASSNLASGRDDPPLAGWQGVFVHDRLTGSTLEVSVPRRGRSGRGWSSWPILSADGRSVAFTTQARLAAEDHNGTEVPVANPLDDDGAPLGLGGNDVYVHTFDRVLR